MATITITNIHGRLLATIEAENTADAIQKLVARGASLEGASLEGASLEGANLYRANLEGANLEGANLEGASLDGASLIGANLDGASLIGANLTRANLTRANLTGASLYRASLEGANLYRASLEGANLYRANLEGASLDGASLIGANLDGANLAGANLDGANLTRANLTRANLTRANLTGANLDGLAKLPPFQICPQEGTFIAYKMAINAKTGVRAVLKLEIPADAQRTSSLVGRKCRASAVKVLSASDGGAKYYSSYDRNFRYHVGAIATPDRFDPDIRCECAHGIHFFITEQEAKDYR